MWVSSGVVTAPGVVVPDGEVMTEAVVVDELEVGEKNRNPEGLDAVDLCISRASLELNQTLVEHSPSVPPTSYSV